MCSDKKKRCGFLAKSQLSLPQGKPSLSLFKDKVCEDRDGIGLLLAFPLPCMVFDTYQLYNVYQIHVELKLRLWEKFQKKLYKRKEGEKTVFNNKILFVIVVATICGVPVTYLIFTTMLQACRCY